MADGHFTTSGRICTVWSGILLGKDCFLQIAQLCLSWTKLNEIHNLQSDCICQSGWIHYTDINFSGCIFLFLSFPVLLFSSFLFSPHTLFLTSSLSYTMCQNLSYNALYIFWQKQVEQYTSPSQTCKRWDARRLSTKWKCSHLEVTASVDLSFPTVWNFAVSELFSKVSVSKRLHSHGFAWGIGHFKNLKFFKFCLEHSQVHRITFKDWHCSIESCLYFEII